MATEEPTYSDISRTISAPAPAVQDLPGYSEVHDKVSAVSAGVGLDLKSRTQTRDGLETRLLFCIFFVAEG